MRRIGLVCLALLAASCGVEPPDRGRTAQAAPSASAVTNVQAPTSAPAPIRTPSPQPTAVLPPQAPVKGVLMLTTDRPCIVTLDGKEIGRLRRNDGDTFLVEPGSHLLGAIATDAKREWAKVLDVPPRERTEVSIRFIPDEQDEAAGFVARPPAIAWVRIPAGEFWMGQDFEAGPRHRVRLTRAFEMSRGPVTQSQWKVLMRQSPVSWELQGDDRPVTNVSWEDTRTFLDRLDKLEPQFAHRLPTEAEWEYACRAGSQSKSLPRDEAARLGLTSRAPAAPSSPNAFGLLGMTGSVAEWCEDWYENTYYEKSPQDDPSGPAVGSSKAFRGGSFATSGDGVHPAARGSYPPTTRTEYIGFRIVRVPK